MYRNEPSMNKRTRGRARALKRKKTRKRPETVLKESGSPKPESAEADGENQTVEDVRLRQYLDLLQNLYSSFHRGASRICGDRAMAAIALAIERVRLKEQGFNPETLTQESALLVLDLIECTILNAPFFKRSPLRQSALTQVSEMYARHFDLLEHFQAVEPLEQFYYRLKK
jgi:hypothetical protein